MIKQETTKGKTMKIKNVNGTFWNKDNNCFGPIQAATEFESIRDLPDVIVCDDTTRCEIMSHGNGDIRWYPDDDLEANAIASVTN